MMKLVSMETAYPYTVYCMEFQNYSLTKCEFKEKITNTFLKQ